MTAQIEHAFSDHCTGERTDSEKCMHIHYWNVYFQCTTWKLGVYVLCIVRRSYKTQFAVVYCWKDQCTWWVHRGCSTWSISAWLCGKISVDINFSTQQRLLAQNIVHGELLRRKTGPQLFLHRNVPLRQLYGRIYRHCEISEFGKLHVSLHCKKLWSAEIIYSINAQKCKSVDILIHMGLRLW